MGIIATASTEYRGKRSDILSIHVFFLMPMLCFEISQIGVFWYSSFR